MAKYINKDDVLSIIKKGIYIEEIYDPDTCEEWVYDAIDKEEVIEKINKLPVILIEVTRGEEQ